MLYSFLYASRSLIPAATFEADLASLIAYSVDRNLACDISGALFYSLGLFTQVIEGPRSKLDSLIEQLAADKRHTEFVMLQYAPITVRRFSGWSLAYIGSSSYVQRSIALALEQSRQGSKPAVEALLSLMQEFAKRD